MEGVGLRVKKRGSRIEGNEQRGVGLKVNNVGN
jgi:hypothetical protein